MTETTPYDADRSAFTRAALARLVLSDTSAELADVAGNLAITRFDDQTGLGGRASEAAAVRESAERLVAEAVIFERERGSSWEEIAGYLGIDADSARERFTPAVERWHRAFEEPYRLDESGRKRVLQLPFAAYDPESVCRLLDLRVRLRVYFNDEHPVSGALRSDSAADGAQAPDYDLGGRVMREDLGRLMRLLARFAHADGGPTDWDAVAAGLRGTDEDELDAWDAYVVEGTSTSLRMRFANVSRDDGLVEVVVSGATDRELRLRIDTLFTVFGPDA
ncbi:hypothetical protein [Yinghuangia seranimata]|uniref:hypothetical protein n=1 Tax=Yinghuangia seranimata TaxID=408067 RepID=UPI00248B7DB0|nr:hypothetical protein [Yinghuangia seranimata]MDI2125474.1 hypothetical protein [Yinghuangia seranimata]